MGKITGRCIECFKICENEIVSETRTISLRGIEVTVEWKNMKCYECGSIVEHNVLGDENFDRVYDEYERITGQTARYRPKNS